MTFFFSDSCSIFGILDKSEIQLYHHFQIYKYNHFGNISNNQNIKTNYLGNISTNPIDPLQNPLLTAHHVSAQLLLVTKPLPVLFRVCQLFVSFLPDFQWVVPLLLSHVPAHLPGVSCVSGAHRHGGVQGKQVKVSNLEQYYIIIPSPYLVCTDLVPIVNLPVQAGCHEVPLHALITPVIRSHSDSCSILKDSLTYYSSISCTFVFYVLVITYICRGLEVDVSVGCPVGPHLLIGDGHRGGGADVYKH